MITPQTKERLAKLAAIITEVSVDLDELLAELMGEADNHLDCAAAEFSKQHAIGSYNSSAYSQAHAELVAMAVAASNIKELVQKARAFRHSSQTWNFLTALVSPSSLRTTQTANDIIKVLAASQAKSRPEAAS